MLIDNKPEFLNETFFQAQSKLTPELSGSELRYQLLIQDHSELLQRRALALEQVDRPQIEAQDLLIRGQAELEEMRRQLGPDLLLDSAPGGWRKPLRRARVNLAVALEKNTVPGPLIPIARGLAWPDDPALTPFKEAVAQSRVRVRETTDVATKQRELTIRYFRVHVDDHLKIIGKEEDQLLTQFEQSVAISGDLDRVVKYLTSLPNGKRETRSTSTLQTFAHTNARDYLMGDEFDQFEAFAKEMAERSHDNRHQKTAARLLEFVQLIKNLTLAAMDQDKDLPPEVYRFQDNFVTRRFEAFIGFALQGKLHKEGVLDNEPQLPQILEYW